MFGYVIVEEVNLDKGDAVGWNSDVIAELVEEIMWNTEWGAAKFKLIRAITETFVWMVILSSAGKHKCELS